MFICLKKYFQKLVFSVHCPAHLYYLWQIIFLVFVTNYPIYWQLLMDVMFGYPLIRQFITIWQA